MTAHTVTTEQVETFFGVASFARCACGWTSRTVCVDEIPDADDPDSAVEAVAAALGLAHSVSTAAAEAKAAAKAGQLVAAGMPDPRIRRR